MPSLHSSRVSMATSLPLPFRSVGSYLHGPALVSSHAALSCPASSCRRITTLRRAASSGVAPSTTSWCQSASSVESVTPHLSVTLAYLVSPLSLRTVVTSSPSRYSMGSLDRSPMATSAKPACWIWLISNRNRKFRSGSCRAAMASPFSGRGSRGRFLGLLEHAEDDELGRTHGRHTDLDDQPPVQDVVLRHGFPADLDAERLLFLLAEQRALPPLGAQEEGDGLPHPGPQPRVVRLEDHPLGREVDGGL